MPTVGLALSAALAVLACEARADVPDVPGDDIFGFTTPTDVGNPGDTGFANENDGRSGKRGGRYHALNAKYELGHTVAADWWVGIAAFGAYNAARNVPDLFDVNRAAFDGLSFEIMYRVVRRSQVNPFALAVAMEPRWARIDGVPGLTSNALNVAFKLFADVVVVPDRLFWAGNVMWTPQRAEDPNDRSRWLSSSSLLVSSAMAYRVSPVVFIGAEARYLGHHHTLFPTREVGRAIYLGPTLLWKITDKVAFNTTFQPQVVGRSTVKPGLRLDLDNFERAQFRAKLAVALP
ncbi:MAG: hypothetical protein K2Y71_09810 [Xanthobacteraceae bacterium]|nr:hypothetical protein [Xanthobacteraceae bacterium]